MPKLVSDDQPASSVSRVLELSAAARSATTPVPRTLARTRASSVPPIPPPMRATPTPPPHLLPPHRAEPSLPTQAPAPSAPMNLQTAAEAAPPIKRELLLTPATDTVFERLLEAYRRGTGTRLTASQMMRAVLRGVEHCFEEVEREALAIGRMPLPSNAKGRELDRERFEARIADAFVAGVRAGSKG